MHFKWTSELSAYTGPDRVTMYPLSSVSPLKWLQPISATLHLGNSTSFESWSKRRQFLLSFD